MGGETSTFLEEFLAQIFIKSSRGHFYLPSFGTLQCLQSWILHDQEANTPQASSNVPNGRRPWGSLPLPGSSKEVRHLGSELLEK